MAITPSTGPIDIPETSGPIDIPETSGPIDIPETSGPTEIPDTSTVASAPEPTPPVTPPVGASEPGLLDSFMNGSPSHALESLKGMAGGVVKGINQIGGELLHNVTNNSALASTPSTVPVEPLSIPVPFQGATAGIIGRATGLFTELALGFATPTGVVSKAQSAATAAKSFGIGEKLNGVLKEFPWIKEYLGVLRTDPSNAEVVSQANQILGHVGVPAADVPIVSAAAKVLTLKESGKASAKEINKAQSDLIGVVRGKFAPGATAIPVSPISKIRGTLGETLPLNPEQQFQYDMALDYVNPRNYRQGVVVDHALDKDLFLRSFQGLGEVSSPILTKATPQYSIANEVNHMGDLLGVAPSEITSAMKITGKTDEEIHHTALGVRQFFTNEGETLSRLAPQVGMGGPKELADFATQFRHLAEMQGKMTQIVKEPGLIKGRFYDKNAPFNSKLLNATLSNPKSAGRLAQLVEIAGGDPAKVAMVLRNNNLSLGTKLMASWNEGWLGLMLLSGVSTHVINNIGNITNITSHQLAGAVGGHPIESAQQVLGMTRGIGVALSAAAKVAKTNKSQLSPSLTSEYHNAAIASSYWNQTPDSALGQGLDYVGNVARASFRGLSTADEFSKQMIYYGHIDALASSQASSLGLKGQAAKDFMAKFHMDSYDPTGAATNQEVMKTVERMTFQTPITGQPSYLPEGTTPGELAAMAAKNPVIRGTLIPFNMNPTNMLRNNFEWTPLLGMARGQFKADIQAGGMQRATAIGKQALGLTFSYYATQLAVDGRITGPPAPGSLKTADGHPPYSVKFEGMGPNGEDAYIPYLMLGPPGWLLGVGATFAHVTGMLDDETRDNLAQQFGAATGEELVGVGKVYQEGARAGDIATQMIEGQSALGNMTKFLSMFSSDQPVEKTYEWLKTQVASHVVPHGLSQFNTDTTLRSTYGRDGNIAGEFEEVLNRIQSKIPGVSSDLEPMRNWFGEVQHVKPGYPLKFSPATVTLEKRDRVSDEAHRLEGSNAKFKFEPMGYTIKIHASTLDMRQIKDASGLSMYDFAQQVLEKVKPEGETTNMRGAILKALQDPDYHLGQKNWDHQLDGRGSSGLLGYRADAWHKVKYTYRAEALEQAKKRFARQLGIQSPDQEKMDTNIGQKDIKAGLKSGEAEKLLNFGK